MNTQMAGALKLLIYMIIIHWNILAYAYELNQAVSSWNWSVIHFELIQMELRLEHAMSLELTLEYDLKLHMHMY